ncbi:hypothetical protein GALMADRAFT_567793 [Galerina marginata CBS 339.88]|uniref:Uncharacterized protein n=1 Tax=Galerina marginata (strain CBS 339.88) TaxID=685588 RepID=A0A067T4S7_GALM3|nr:hypothetical protein GALMADRAFT_567793 [Galerina marginata CBS 339.88]
MPAEDTRGDRKKGKNRNFHVVCAKGLSFESEVLTLRLDLALAGHSGPGQRAPGTQVSRQTSSGRGRNQRHSRRSTDVVPVPLPSIDR